MAKHQRLLCMQCHEITEKPKKVMPGSAIMELLLWLFFLLPGMLYSVWRYHARTSVCPTCTAADLIPANSKRAQSILSKAMLVLCVGILSSAGLALTACSASSPSSHASRYANAYCDTWVICHCESDPFLYPGWATRGDCFSGIEQDFLDQGTGCVTSPSIEDMHDRHQEILIEVEMSCSVNGSPCYDLPERLGGGWWGRPEQEALFVGNFFVCPQPTPYP